MNVNLNNVIGIFFLAFIFGNELYLSNSKDSFEVNMILSYELFK